MNTTLPGRDRVDRRSGPAAVSGRPVCLFPRGRGCGRRSHSGGRAMSVRTGGWPAVAHPAGRSVAERSAASFSVMSCRSSIGTMPRAGRHGRSPGRKGDAGLPIASASTASEPGRCNPVDRIPPHDLTQRPDVSGDRHPSFPRILARCPHVPSWGEISSEWPIDAFTS